MNRVLALLTLCMSHATTLSPAFAEPDINWSNFPGSKCVKALTNGTLRVSDGRAENAHSAQSLRVACDVERQNVVGEFGSGSHVWVIDDHPTLSVTCELVVRDTIGNSERSRQTRSTQGGQDGRSPVKLSFGAAEAFPSDVVVISCLLPPNTNGLSAVVGARIVEGRTDNHPNVSSVFGAPSDDAASTFVQQCPVGDNRLPSRPSQVSICSGPDRLCLRRVTVDVTSYPEAVCGDGTPGVFYVRRGTTDPATGTNNENKWMIHLQGGGRCDDYESCRDRWCGNQGEIYSANKMSTDWDADGTTDLPPLGSVNGVHVTNLNNPFATWTHVFVYYCSSDSWVGRGDALYDPPLAGLPKFSVQHRGHQVLSAMREMLRRTNPDPTWVPDPDLNDGSAEAAAIPDLDSAEEVWFTGTSAGAKGTVMNADWFLSGLPSGTTRRVVLDANLGPTELAAQQNAINVDLGCDGTPDLSLYDYRLGLEEDKWDMGWNQDVDAFADQSCRNHLEPQGRLAECSDFTPLLSGGRTIQIGPPFGFSLFLPYVSQPVFLRVDLEDRATRRFYGQILDDGACFRKGSGASPPRTTQVDFTPVARASMEELYTSNSPVTGIFGPRCGQHVGLEDNRAYASHTTPDTLFNLEVSNTRTNFANALDAWRTATLGVSTLSIGLFRRLDTALASPTYSVCP